MIALLRTVSLLVFLASCAQAPAPTKRGAPRRKAVRTARPQPVIEAPKADAKLQQKLAQRNAVILDLRDVNDFVNGHLKGAQHMDLLKDDFEAQVGKLDRSKKYLLYCSNGGRSGKAMRYFMAKKLRVENIGTFDDLKSRGAPVEGIEE